MARALSRRGSRRSCGSGELELAAYVEGEAPPRARRRVDVEPGWEERWREFHRPVRVGPFWIGPPWETPAADAVPLVIDPGRAFGTGAHATTRLCIELLSELEPGSLLDVGCGSGVVAIAAAQLGFSPVLGVDVDTAAVEAARSERRRERRRDRRSRCRRDDGTARAGRRRRREHLAPARRVASATHRGPRRRRRPATSSATSRGSGRTCAACAACATAGPRTCSNARSRVSPHGDLRRPLPRLQGVASRRAGRPRAAARRGPHRARGRRRRGRQHVLRHARGALEVAPGSRARRPHASPRVRHRLRGEPRRRRARRPARQRRRRRAPQRGDAGCGRRGRRRARLRATRTRGSSAFAHS